MTAAEQLSTLKALTGESDEVILQAFLKIAADKVLRRAYPFDSTKKVVPEQYHIVQVEIAAYLFNKRGAEGQTAHSENGVSRSYEDGDVPHSLLRCITPFASVIEPASEVSGT